jgi:hypothetical protein
MGEEMEEQMCCARMNARNIVWSGSMALRTVGTYSKGGDATVRGLKKGATQKSLLFAAQWEGLL